MTTTLLHGDNRMVLPTLPAASVQCVVTSPPYFGLRDYGAEGQIGLEQTPAEYVAALVAVFREVKRVLRDDGVLWLNLGDSYGGERGNKTPAPQTKWAHTEADTPGHAKGDTYRKQLLGIPWRVAFALQDDGWYLRSDVIWAKPNCMPESVRDRPTRAHEYIFLLTKRPRYFYDADAIRDPYSENTHAGGNSRGGEKYIFKPTIGGHKSTLGGKDRDANPAGRNKRTVWTVSTTGFSGAHFAVFPEALVEPCILAGSAAQACPVCGAAWVRQTEDPYKGQKGSLAEGNADPQGVGALRDENGRLSWGEHHPNHSLKWWTTRTTTGFSPACACAGNDGSGRSVVLDPFAGSGTTLRVAERLGRDSIGIELNAEYLRLQEKRTDGVQRAMTEVLYGD